MFSDRTAAGEKLAEALHGYGGKPVVILALPRGGVVLGDIAAKALKAPLDLVMVCKLSHPSSPEYAVGAVAETDEPVLGEEVDLISDQAWLEPAVTKARALIAKRRQLYYGNAPERPALKSKTAILVDDGLATGLTMQAALAYAKKQSAAEIVVAVPVASKEAVTQLRERGAKVIVLEPPASFLGSVGAHYRDFAQVTDREVASLLKGH